MAHGMATSYAIAFVNLYSGLNVFNTGPTEFSR